MFVQISPGKAMHQLLVWMCVILLVKGIFCRCLSSVLHLWFILTLGFYFSLYDLYIDESEILQSGLICLFMFRGVLWNYFNVWCMYVYHCYVFLMAWFWYWYLQTFFLWFWLLFLLYVRIATPAYSLWFTCCADFPCSTFCLRVSPVDVSLVYNKCLCLICV